MASGLEVRRPARRLIPLVGVAVLWPGSHAALGQWSAVRLHQDAWLESEVGACYRGQQGGRARSTSADEPALWRGSAASFTSLWTGAAEGGSVRGLGEAGQVGFLNADAYLWHGTPADRVKLTPPGALNAMALATAGGMQSGYASFGVPGSFEYAGYWRGTAESWVTLHPTAAQFSEALATDGIVQGGFVHFGAPSFATHAALWNGTAESFIDMNPPGTFGSHMYGMAPGQQVGSAFVKIGGIEHAAVWSGTPQSFRDLNPPGAGYSVVYATTGEIQVGTVGVSGALHAAVWFGTAESWVDLHQFLPAAYSLSQAYSVSVWDRTLTVGGYGRLGGQQQAWIWTMPIPAPAGGVSILLATGIPSARRPQRRSP